MNPVGIGVGVAIATSFPDSDSELKQKELDKQIYPCVIPDSYWKCIKKRAICIAERAGDECAVRLIDLKSLVCHSEFQDGILHPHLFKCLEYYYPDALVRVAVNQGMPVDSTFPIAIKVASVMQDMKVYPALCAQLGEYVLSVLDKSDESTVFLEKTVPVKSRPNPVHEDKQGRLFDLAKQYLKSIIAHC